MKSLVFKSEDEKKIYFFLPNIITNIIVISLCKLVQVDGYDDDNDENVQKFSMLINGRLHIWQKYYFFSVLFDFKTLFHVDSPGLIVNQPKIA